MHRIEARIVTASASKYLQQLCKHWSHKFAVSFSQTEGRIPFSEDRDCALVADAEGLTVRVCAPNAPDALRLGAVVIDHLRRFAHREDLADPDWAPI